VLTAVRASTSLFTAVAIISAGKFLFAIQDVVIKEMSDAFPVHQVMVIRGLVAIPIMLLLIHFTAGLGILRHHRPGPHLLRGALMLAAFTCFYVALAGTPLTTATALFFTAPFFITILAIPLLGEKVGLRRFAGIGVGFVGVLLVLRPEAGSFSGYSLLPVLAGFLYACCQLMVRVLKMTEPPALMSLYASVAFVVLGGLAGILLAPVEAGPDAAVSLQFLLRDWSMPAGYDLLLLLSTGLTSALGFMFNSNAYQRAPASRIAPFEYVMIVWVTLLSFFVWGELPDRVTLAGIALIIGSGLYVLRREAVVDDDAVAAASLTRR